MKKSFITFAVVIAIIGAAVFAVISSNNRQREFSELELANIEALTEAETTTSWKCVGDGKKCEIKCGLCNTYIKGNDTLTGSHSCVIN